VGYALRECALKDIVKDPFPGLGSKEIFYMSKIPEETIQITTERFFEPIRLQLFYSDRRAKIRWNSLPKDSPHEHC